VSLRETYSGVSLLTDYLFDAELVRYSNYESEKGKAASLDNLSAEHVF
jgi:hypothetical protein